MPEIDRPTPQWTMGGYAMEEEERGIIFKEVPKKGLQELGDTIQVIADQLWRAPPPIPVPPKGILAHPLEDAQRRALEALMFPRYAERHHKELQSLKAVPIHENEEPMVELMPVLQHHNVAFTYSDRKFHEACGSYADSPRIIYLRRDVAHKAALVFRALNSVGLMAHVEDCWRPPEVQAGLYTRRIVNIVRRYSEWNAARIRTAAGSITASSPGFAGHCAGAAVDWLLREKDDWQKFQEAGNVYAEGGASSCMDWPYVTFPEYRTRIIFLLSATMGGFKTLSTEDWHMSDGDRGMVEGQVKMKSARYGPLRDFHRAQGTIVPYPPEKIPQPFLKKEDVTTLIEMSKERSEGRFRWMPGELYGWARQRWQL